MQTLTNLLYLHGFNSSPLSHKAEVTKHYIAVNFPDINFVCPQLVASPLKAIAQIESILHESACNRWGIIGSSLGGYYATYLAHKYNYPAVLVNPAVKPYDLLTDYMGEQINPYSQEVYQVEEPFIADLIDIEVLKIVKKQYMLMVQTGDEVLNYQEAVDKYQGCHTLIQEGGDHSFIDFDKYLPNIMHFFNNNNEN